MNTLGALPHLYISGRQNNGDVCQSGKLEAYGVSKELSLETDA
jgi:hypothetical protein